MLVRKRLHANHDALFCRLAEELYELCNLSIIACSKFGMSISLGKRIILYQKVSFISDRCQMQRFICFVQVLRFGFVVTNSNFINVEIKL